MQRNLLHYQRALFLRKKKGYSYSEIMAEIPVAKSTLSGWLSSIELSSAQKGGIFERGLFRLRQHNKRLNLGEWNRNKRQKEITRIRVSAKNGISTMGDRELLIAGIMLYWAEGGKANNEIRFSNADPALIKFIMFWFRNSLKISNDRFNASVHYHIGQSEDELKIFWSKTSGIPSDQFRKGFCKPPGTGHRKHYLQHGTLQIRVTKSSDFFHLILGWRDGLIADIISGKTLK